MIVIKTLHVPIVTYQTDASCLKLINTASKKQECHQPNQTMEDPVNNPKINRRKFLTTGVSASVLIGIGGMAAFVAKKSIAGQTVWQLDPAKCIQCGRCATNCVLSPSAVKCTHVYVMCGYCDLCGGYFKPETKTLNTGAENQLCPTNAIKRKFIEDPFFEYSE